MNTEEAANVIANVCAKWEGTIADGDVIKAAFGTLVAAAGVDALAAAAAAVPPAEPDKPTPPNRAARRAKGPTKKAARPQK